MPTPNSPLRIAVLLTEQTSLGLSLLMREIFERANEIVGRKQYEVELISTSARGRIAQRDVIVSTSAPRRRYDFLVVTPTGPLEEGHVANASDLKLVLSQHEKGAVIASACLGALMLAEAGVLDGLEATTHWRWASIVRHRYPKVRWAVNKMISHQRTVITAGGYMAIVDLALYIVSLTAPRTVAHRLGQILLADSVRQKQSIYAQTLTAVEIEQGPLRNLPAWIENHLHQPLSVAALAERYDMSLRTFHRSFVTAFGTTPRKLIQLKRIEKAQKLLRSTTHSVEQILQSVGVSDVASFRRVFQRELGCSPAEFRRRLKAQQLPATARPS